MPHTGITKYLGKFVAAVLTAILTLVAVCGFAFGNQEDPPALTYNSMEYDVTVLENGDVHIKQTVDVRLRQRKDGNGIEKPWRQLYGRYTLQATQATSMVDVWVKDLDTGEVYDPSLPADDLPGYYTKEEWEDEYAHTWYLADVSDGQEYGAPAFDPYRDGLEVSNDGNSSKRVELGWNIPDTFSAESRKFELEYTYTNVFTDYQDVTKAQISLFDSANNVPVGSVTARLHLPKGSDSANTWEWFHFEGNSHTERVDDNTYLYQAWNLRGGQYFDILLMLDRDLMRDVQRKSSGKVKDSTIQAEAESMRKWNFERRIRSIVSIVIWVVVAGGALMLGIRAFRAALRNRYNAEYHGPIEYWREPPSMSPVAATQMLQFLKTGAVSIAPRGNQRSAAILALVEKKAIAVYPGSASRYSGIKMRTANFIDVARLLEEKESGKTYVQKIAERRKSTFVMLPAAEKSRKSLGLSPSENAMLRFLSYAADKMHTTVFDTGGLRKALKKDTTAAQFLRAFDTAAESEFKSLHAVKLAPKSASHAGWGVVLAMSVTGFYCACDMWSRLMLLLALVFPLMTFGFFSLYVNSKYVLSSVRNKRAGQVLGFKRYLEEFSSFTDRPVLDVALWGRFMVYATALGISKTALQQLVKAYPKVLDRQWLNNNAASDPVVYWSVEPQVSLHDAFGLNLGEWNGASSMSDLGSQLNSSFNGVSSAIQSSTSSDGGFGGGFGGGGGGAGGGSYGGR